MQVRSLIAAGAWSVLLAAGLAWSASGHLNAQSGALTLETLSNRADMISGGNALVELRGAGTAPTGVSIAVNGRDQTRAFAADAARGSLVGLVEGLKDGANTIEAKAGNRTARLTVTNYPNVGPVFSGPHLTPFECRTEQSGLGAPLDANCSATTNVEYFYRSTAPPPPPAAGRGGRGAAGAAGATAAAGQAPAADADDADAPAARRSPFKPLPVGPRPTDIAQTTTTDGRTVPFIVRVESGTINRAIYRISILDDPATSASVWKPGAGWNHRLLFSFGGGCGTNYNQGTNQATAALDEPALSKGFAFAVSTQNVMGQHCNDAISGEALMMIKEHFVEAYGIPAWTVGRGGSGGAIQQLLIGQNYPGLLDGLMPSLTFPDSFSLRNGVVDCRLMINYGKAHPGALTDEQMVAVQGHTAGTCAAWDRGLANVILADYTQGCGIAKDKVFDPVTNPKGARCTLWDTNVASFGRDPRTGFARRSYDNIGLQYGLQALNAGVITKAQFLDLNAGIGGIDDNGHLVAQRTAGDPEAIRLAYLTGRVDSGAGGLGSVPILHYRSYNDPLGDIHDRFRDFSMRARLMKNFGRADNEVIWLYNTRDTATGTKVAAQALETMGAWLDGIKKDTSSRQPIDKVVAAKPAKALDGCWDKDGNRIDDSMTFEGKSPCNTLYPVHTNARMVAGGPLADDVMKCQLKPIAAADYKVAFTADEQARLKQIFPNGVCDYSKPSQHRVALAGTFLRLPLSEGRQPSTGGRQ